MKKGRKKLDKTWRWDLIMGLVFVVVVIGSIFVLQNKSPTECPTEECFVRLANKCRPATFANSLATASLMYEIQEDCRFSKEVTAVSPTEPEAVRVLFEGAQLRCSYEKGAFNVDLLSSFTKGTDLCEGSLKEIVALV